MHTLEYRKAEPTRTQRFLVDAGRFLIPGSLFAAILGVLLLAWLPRHAAVFAQFGSAVPPYMQVILRLHLFVKGPLGLLAMIAAIATLITFCSLLTSYPDAPETRRRRYRLLMPLFLIAGSILIVSLIGATMLSLHTLINNL